MQPPENLSVTEWAECKWYLSNEVSAEPGLWRTNRTPYLRAIIDAFADPKVRHIVFVAASQVGKTEVINNMIGYIIAQNPGSILFVHPTTIVAREFSELRIAPMIRDSPALKQKISAPKSRDSGNTLMSPKKYQLDMRVAEEFWDVEQADVGLWAGKYVMIVRPKTTTPGTVAPMASADTSSEYVVCYFAAYKNDEQLWEVDKRNMRCVILGVDYMAEVRKALGK